MQDRGTLKSAGKHARHPVSAVRPAEQPESIRISQAHAPTPTTGPLGYAVVDCRVSLGPIDLYAETIAG